MSRSGPAILLSLLFLLVPTLPALGQDASEAAGPVSKLRFHARTGLDSGFTFRFLQAIHERGRWIGPDVGFIDFGDASAYREAWIGGGGVAHASKLWFVALEALFAFGSGETTADTVYVQPWMLVGYRPRPRLAAELVYFEYLPLDDRGTRQRVLDRAKLERDLGRFKVGAGYAGFQFGDGSWDHRPFLSATRKLGGTAELELWVQRDEDFGGESQTQVQIRFALLEELR